MCVLSDHPSLGFQADVFHILIISKMGEMGGHGSGPSLLTLGHFDGGEEEIVTLILFFSILYTRFPKV